MLSFSNLKEANLSDTIFNSIERINKLPGRRFEIPKFTTITFTANIGHLRNLPMVSNWIEDMFECSKLSENTFDVNIRNLFECVFHFFPICYDLARYEWIFKYVYLIFIIDDHCELDLRDLTADKVRVMTILEQLRQSMFALRHNKPLSTDREWEPYIKVNHQVLSMICGAYNHMQSIRFIGAYEDFLEGLSQETLGIVEKMPRNSIDEYFKVHLKASAGLSAFQLTEYCLGLTLTEAEYEERLTQKCIRYANKCCALCNDIFSFEKEFNQSNGELDRMWNAVATHAVINGCPVEEAIVAIARLNNHCEQKLMQSISKAVNRNNMSKDLCHFIKHLQLFVGGNIKFHTLVDRYNYFYEPAKN